MKPSVFPWVALARAGGPTHAVVDAGAVRDGVPRWAVTACGRYVTGAGCVVRVESPEAAVACRSCLRRIR